MKRSVIIVVAVLMALPAMVLAEEDPCKDASLKKLREHILIPQAGIVSKRPVSGMCEVILDMQGRYVAVYTGPDYVIAGQMFKSRVAITRTEIERLKATRFVSLRDEVDKCVAMTLKPANSEVSTTVYMITDPLCPYCQKSEAKILEFANKYGAEFKLILYSVHPPVGREKAIEAVCRGLSAKEYLDGAWKKDEKTQECAKGKALIERTEQLARKLGIRGVPMFFFSDGTLVQGANFSALEKALSFRMRSKVSYAK